MQIYKCEVKCKSEGAGDVKDDNLRSEFSGVSPRAADLQGRAEELLWAVVHYEFCLLSSSSVGNVILISKLFNNGSLAAARRSYNRKKKKKNASKWKRSEFPASVLECARGFLRTSDGEEADTKTPFNTTSTQAEELCISLHILQTRSLRQLHTIEDVKKASVAFLPAWKCCLAA